MSETKKGGVPVLGMAVIVWVLVWAFLKFFVKNIPLSVMIEYMSVVTGAILVFYTIFDDDLDELFDPILSFFAGGEGQNPLLKGARLLVLVAVPLGIGWNTYQGKVPNYTPPNEIRATHPAPPTEYSGLASPIEGTEMDLMIGFGLYTAYCSPCHGNNLDGKGPAAYGFKPPPINFRNPATIAQLQESFLFWRIKKGGIGMPVEGQPWNSVMPRWEGFGRKGEIAVPDEHIWMIIKYLYKGTDQKPRTWS